MNCDPIELLNILDSHLLQDDLEEVRLVLGTRFPHPTFRTTGNFWIGNKRRTLVNAITVLGTYGPDSVCALCDAARKVRNSDEPLRQELAQLCQPCPSLSPPRRCCIAWLHISDLHLHPPDYGADVVLEGLILDVKKVMAKYGIKPDFIAVTGDIAHTGKQKEYERAVAFFDKLLKVTNLSKSHLYLVPGNHDIDWSLIIEQVAEEHRTNLTSKDSVDATLGSLGKLRRIYRKFRPYRRFVNTYLTDAAGHSLRPCDHRHLSFTENLRLNGITVSVIGLNSAWMSAYNWEPGKEYEEADDHGNLVLGRRQLREALKAAVDDTGEEKPDLVVSLMHHPIECFKEGIDREEVEALLEQNCHFILRGHLHDNKLVQFKSPGGEAITITAGASFKTRAGKLDYNGYNFVQLDLTNGKGTIFLRAYSRKYSEFWAPDVFSYPDLDEGCMTFTAKMIPRSDLGFV